MDVYRRCLAAAIARAEKAEAAARDARTALTDCVAVCNDVRRNLALCAENTAAAELAQEVEFLKAELGVLGPVYEEKGLLNLRAVRLAVGVLVLIVGWVFAAAEWRFHGDLSWRSGVCFGVAIWLLDLWPGRVRRLLGEGLVRGKEGLLRWLRRGESGGLSTDDADGADGREEKRGLTVPPKSTVADVARMLSTYDADSAENAAD